MSNRTAPQDPVEADMASGVVLRRDKVVARNLALICLAMFLVFGAASIAYLRGWRADTSALVHWITYFMVPFAAWVGLTKTVLRTVVTPTHVRSQQGFHGVSIPVASITMCRTMKPSDMPVRGRELYFPAGRDGILVDWRDETGKERKALIGSEDGAALAECIERARAVASTGLRVAEDETNAAADELAEQEAAEEATRRAKH